jgi:hypothetical protein
MTGQYFSQEQSSNMIRMKTFWVPVCLVKSFDVDYHLLVSWLL